MLAPTVCAHNDHCSILTHSRSRICTSQLPCSVNDDLVRMMSFFHQWTAAASLHVCISRLHQSAAGLDPCVMSETTVCQKIPSGTFYTVAHSLPSNFDYSSVIISIKTRNYYVSLGATHQ